jgi:hypothetical protein
MLRLPSHPRRNNAVCLPFLSDWSPTTRDHTASRSGILGSNGAMSVGDGRTIEPRIRFSRRGGGSARCSGSRARVQPRNFFPRTPPSTTFLTSNGISLQPKRTAPFALSDDHVANSSRSSLTIADDAPRSPDGDVTIPLGVVSWATIGPKAKKLIRCRIVLYGMSCVQSVQKLHLPGSVRISKR